MYARDRMKAKIFVTLKPGIHDPQGRAIQQSLATLGFSTIQGVRMGKYLEVEVAEDNKDQAEATVKSICEKLLANPVIEDFNYELVESV